MSMNEFGLPARTATQDANDGIVNPPALKTTPRAFETSKTKNPNPTAREAVLDKVGTNLGGALQSFMDKDYSNKQEQKALDAALRQGEQTAINDIDSTKKRAPWERFVFGDSVEYRAAQQKATQNLVGQQYLEESYKINEYSNLEPAEYHTHIRNQLNRMLAPHAADPETKALITKSWAGAAEKLTTKHYSNHYAWNLMQQREVESDRIQGQLDIANTDMQQTTGPEALTQTLKMAGSIFDIANRPKGMSPQVKRELLLERTHYNLRAGNISAYNLLKMSSLHGDLKEDEIRSLKESVSVYDTNFIHSVSRTKTQAEYRALGALTTQEAEQVWEDFDSDLVALANRSSGTERSKAALEAAALWSRKLLIKGMQAGTKAESEARDMEDAIATYDIADIAEMVGTQQALINDPERSINKAKMDRAADIWLTRQAGDILGNPDMTEKELVVAMSADPELTKVLAPMWLGTGRKSNMIKTFASATITASDRMVDTDNDQYSDAYKKQVESLSILAENPQFKAMLSNDEYAHWTQIRKGIAMGDTHTMIQKRFKDVKEGREHLGKYKQNMSAYLKRHFPEGTDTRDYVASAVKRATGRNPTAQSLGEYMVEWDEALAIHQGDIPAAADELRKVALRANINYQGYKIDGGQFLNESVGEYDFEGFMDGIQTGKNTLLSPYLMNLTGDRDANYQRLHEVRGLEIYVLPGIPGFHMTAPDAVAPVHVTQDGLDGLVEALRVRNNQAEIRDELKAARKATKILKDKQFREDYLNRPRISRPIPKE